MSEVRMRETRWTIGGADGLRGAGGGGGAAAAGGSSPPNSGTLSRSGFAPFPNSRRSLAVGVRKAWASSARAFTMSGPLATRRFNSALSASFRSPSAARSICRRSVSMRS